MTTEYLYQGKKIREYSTVEDGRKIKKPVRNLMNYDTASLEGVKVVDYSAIQGNFADGTGPGFFGLLLENPCTKKREWLVATIGFGITHCLFDGRWVGASSAFFEIQKPLIYYSDSKKSDDFGPAIRGAVIGRIAIDAHSCTIFLNNKNEAHKLEILNRDARLSPHANFFHKDKDGVVKNAPLIAFKEGDSMGEYIVLMEEAGQIYIS